MKQVLKNVKNSISLSITNSKGIKLDKKIIVIESDDWGSIRMPNIKTRDEFEKKGYKIAGNPYCRFDTLANSEDLNRLFDTLLKFKDINGNNPIITANTVVANPDFYTIKKSNYLNYNYKSFTNTLEEYYPNEDIFKIWEQGLTSKIFIPQYHGREHVNVKTWFKELQNKNKIFLDAFTLGFWGVPRELYNSRIPNIQAAYNSNKEEDLAFFQNSISTGLQLFEDIFKYKSKTFIANNYTWPTELNKTLFESGIEGIQGMKYQKTPNTEGSKLGLIPSFTGKLNEFGQVYTVRNCVFEPSQMPNNFNNVKTCINQIQNAFFFKKPAIITSHRLNYIGVIEKQNREQNLSLLEKLLNQIIMKWPDVIFMSSDQLTDHLINTKLK